MISIPVNESLPDGARGALVGGCWVASSQLAAVELVDQADEFLDLFVALSHHSVLVVVKLRLFEIIDGSDSMSAQKGRSKEPFGGRDMSPTAPHVQFVAY